jgi:hypothetical protein
MPRIDDFNKAMQLQFSNPNVNPYSVKTISPNSVFSTTASYGVFFEETTLIVSNNHAQLAMDTCYAMNFAYNAGLQQGILTASSVCVEYFTE